MSDHAATVRDALSIRNGETVSGSVMERWTDALAALDALVAERDEWEGAWAKEIERAVEAEARAEAAEAEVQKMLHDKDEDVERIVARAEAAEARVVVLEAECAAWGEGCKQREATIEAAEARVTELEARVKICAHCASGYVPNPGDEHKEGCAGCRRFEALDAALTACEEERDVALNSNATLTKAWYAARKERDQLCVAIASAMGSLATGPARDGYAYSVLGEALSAALAATGKEDTDE